MKRNYRTALKLNAFTMALSMVVSLPNAHANRIALAQAPDVELNFRTYTTTDAYVGYAPLNYVQRSEPRSSATNKDAKVVLKYGVSQRLFELEGETIKYRTTLGVSSSTPGIAVRGVRLVRQEDGSTVFLRHTGGVNLIVPGTNSSAPLPCATTTTSGNNVVFNLEIGARAVIASGVNRGNFACQFYPGSENANIEAVIDLLDTNTGNTFQKRQLIHFEHSSF